MWSLERLKKEAKRRLAALREAGDRAAALRDVQLALAREQGFAGWTELKRAAERAAGVAAGRLAHFEDAADALLDAYRTGTPEAMERLYRYARHRRAWP